MHEDVALRLNYLAEILNKMQHIETRLICEVLIFLLNETMLII